MAKISIIIPVYNTEKWLSACLDSVFGQQGVEIECIVVDDCGGDRAIEVAERYADDRLKIVRHTHNRGLSVSRNTGVEVATGEWIFFLDSDDTLPIDALTVLAAEAGVGVDWVQGSFRRVDSEREWYTTYPSARYTTRQEIAHAYDILNFTNATNKLIRADFARCLKFCEGLIYEDSLWCAQAYGLIRSVTAVSVPTYNHNVRQGSIMQSRFTEHKIESLLHIIEQMMAMEPDTNLQHTATYNAVYLIKNLYLHHFSYSFRRAAMRRLESSGVFMVSINRRALPPLSRLLSYGFRLPYCYYHVVCFMYGLVGGR